MSSLLAVDGVAHAYRTRQGRVDALGEVNFTLPAQTFTCLVGPSGCGKSTLLRIIAGLVKPAQGRILLNGQPLTRPQRQIGLVFQNPNLMPWRTVYNNLTLPLEIAGVSPSERRGRAERILSLMGLSEFAESYPAALSGGMAQRVAVGRAFMQQPEILLLDEPFGALDALTREQVSEELLRVWMSQRTTVLMVTHSIQEAVLLSDRVLVMSPRPGRVVADIPISLPRPRTLKMVTEPAFAQLEIAVREGLGRR